MLELHLVSGYVARVGIRDAEWCLYHMSGSAGRARPWPWCSPTTELHVASDCAPLASGPTVTLSNMELCAKTHEVRHTPTPVRVSEVLHAATWGPRHDPRGHGRDFYWCGPVSSAQELLRTPRRVARGPRLIIICDETASPWGKG